MATEIADGVLGLEARHTWQGLTMNRRDGVFPDIWLDKIAGLHSLAPADDNRIPHTGRIGEWALPGSRRGKNVTYEGRLLGDTLQELRQIRNQAAAAFGGIAVADDLEMTVAPHPTYGDVEHFYKARVLDFDPDDEQTRGPTAVPTEFQREFTLTLHQSDPRYFVVGMNTESRGSAGEITAADGLVNEGLESAELRLSVAGAIAADTTITFERRNPGIPLRTLVVVTKVAVDAGQTLRVIFGEPFGKRRVVIEDALGDEEDVTRWVTFWQSNWWNERVNGLVAGDNVVYGSRAFTVDWYHTNP